MADSFTQVPPDSTGDKIDTEQLTVNAQTVERQRIQIAGTADTDIAPVDATAGLKVDLGSDNDVIQSTASNLNAQVVGTIAHDSPDSGNPVKIGGKAFTTLPTAAANLDRVDLSMASQGGAVVAGDDAGTPREIAVNSSGQLEVDIVAQQLSPVVVSGTVTADAGTGTFNVDLDSLASVAIAVDNGASSTGTQRVTIADDSTGIIDVTDRAGRDLGGVDLLTAIPTGANSIGGVAPSGTHLYDDTSTPGKVEVKFASVDVASSGDNSIVALVAGKEIRVISYVLVASGGANTLFWNSSVGGPLSGGMGLADTGGISANSNTGLFATVAGEALELNLSAATSVDGHISYIEVD